MSGSAELITNEVRRLVLTCRHLQAELEQSIPKKAHQEIVASMQETIDSQSEEMKQMEAQLEKAAAISSTLANLESLLSSQEREIASQNKFIEEISAKIAEGTVPRQVYEQSLSVSKSLEENVRTITEQKNAEIKTLEMRNHDLLEKMSGMVPRSDYLAIQGQLADTIPRIKHEDDMQRMRDQNSRAEARISELETTLEHSVPKAEFVELMKEVSTLTNGPIEVPETVTETEKSLPAEIDAPAPQPLTN
jgi:chromosome segregation ATPase